MRQYPYFLMANMVRVIKIANTISVTKQMIINFCNFNQLFVHLFEAMNQFKSQISRDEKKSLIKTIVIRFSGIPLFLDC